MDCGPDLIPQGTHCLGLWGLNGGNACLRRADPTAVVVPHVNVCEKNFARFVAYCWIHSTHSVSSTRFSKDYKGGGVNADTGNSANFRLNINSIRLVLEATALQWIEGKKEHTMTAPRFLTTFLAFMESLGLPVAEDN